MVTETNTLPPLRKTTVLVNRRAYRVEWIESNGEPLIIQAHNVFGIRAPADLHPHFKTTIALGLSGEQNETTNQ